MTKKFHHFISALVVPAALIAASPAMALNVNDDLVKIQGGTASCSGNVAMAFRNINPNVRLKIERIQILDKDAGDCYDSNTDGYPAGFSNVLEPQSSTRFDSNAAVALGAGSCSGPPQVKVRFTNRSKYNLTKIVEGLPPRIGGWATKDNGAGITGVHSIGCRYVAVTFAP